MLEQPINHTVISLDGETFALGVYRGLAMLIVNITTTGDLTSLRALQQLADEYVGRGLIVIAVPSEDLGDGGSIAEVQARLAALDFEPSFPIFAPMRVTGSRPSHLFQSLTQYSACPGEIIAPFTKFVVDPDGYVCDRFEADVALDDPQVTAALDNVLPTMC